MRQGSTSVRLLQTEQRTMRCFTSRSAAIESFEFSFRRAHDVKGQSLRRLVSDAGQSFQFVDEFGDWFSVF